VNGDELAAVLAALQALTPPEATPANEQSAWKRTARLEAIGADV
jgi:hypothetical protein